MTINYEEFQKMELKVGTIMSAERVEGSEKLVKLMVDIGDPVKSTSADHGADEGDLFDAPDQTEQKPKYRQILAGIVKAYAPEALVGKQIVIVANLEPRKLMGMESQGMLLAATDSEGLPVVLMPEHPVQPGAGIK